MVAHASVASSKCKVELDSNADRCVVGDNCLVTHDHNRPVNIYSYSPKDGHRSAKSVNAALVYWDPHSGLRCVLMSNQVIQINGLVNHLLCPIQYLLNDVHISEVSKFQLTTYAIHLLDPFDTTYPLIIPLQLCSVTSYFDVYSPSIVEYENKDIPKIHITAEEPFMRSINRKIFRKRGLYVRSLRSNSIFQYHYLVLIVLWCQWCHESW